MTTGDKVPNFTLPNQNGEKVEFYSILKNRPVVVFFYPKDNTPGCTAEACAFRDSYEIFTEAGAEVVGISSDGEKSHLAFAQKHRLPYTLLSDRLGSARKLFGVPKTLGLLPGRVTYVVDKDGMIKHRFNSQFNFGKHIDEALKTVKRLNDR
ncbi:MAG: peroxiredoxin [Cryomorphaceae bacterium]|nr:peroxiredoxin [Flavobacteriales bacterium]